MYSELNAFEKHVITGILATNDFGITAVNELTSLNSLYFFQDEYPSIKALAEAKDIMALKSLKKGEKSTNHYLEILTFKDQNNHQYLVTVYDNDDLWQDPQVIDIFQ